MIQERPDLFLAYLGTGQVADEPQNYAVAYKALLNKAQATGNKRALDELNSIGPPPYASYKVPPHHSPSPRSRAAHLARFIANLIIFFCKDLILQRSRQ
jgi:hypothetical protein